MALKTKEKDFRVNIHFPLESELTLINVEANLENVIVIVENVGPGGLRFISNLNLRNDQEVIYSLNSDVLEDKILLPGTVIWKEELSNELYQYGVHFNTPETTRSYLNKLLGA
ncbi:PilZ domain-containing protein [Neobacillus sp. GCM10023253]|uniref:PilZ domain-containing protein n=1 Tax=Neobacillus sp. GCM10023253 TaxID=3252644 RepID=UPI003623A917